MIELLFFVPIGLLLIFVFPQAIKYFLLIVVTYYTIMVHWYFSVFYVPVLILMLIYKNKKEKSMYGWE